MTLSSSSRWMPGVLLLGVIFSAPAKSQVTGPPFYEVIGLALLEIDSALCGYTQNYTEVSRVAYPCDGSGSSPENGLTSDQSVAFTGIAFNYCQTASNPGPFLVNECNLGQEEPAAKDGGSCPATTAAEDPGNALGDPVDVTTGFLSLTPTDFDLGHGLRFARHYSTAAAQAGGTVGPMGLGWGHSLQWTLQRPTDTSGFNLSLVLIHAPFRTPAVFMKSQTGSNYLPSQRGDGSVTVDADGTLHYTAEDGTVATFSPPPSNQLISLQPVGDPLITVSANGNTTTYSNGQQTIVVTTNAGQVSTVTGGGQTWSYTYDASQNLKTVTGPDPTSPGGSNTITWTYAYGTAGLTEIDRSDLTQPLATWTYGPSYPTNLVGTANEPTLDQPLSFSYSNYSSTTLNTTVSAGSNQLAVFNTANGVISSVTNPSGPPNPSQSGVNVPGGAGVPVPFASATTNSVVQWQTKTDKNGNVTSYSNYDAFGNPGSISESDSQGNLVRQRAYTYHPVLKTPLTITEASAVTGVFGDKVTTLDYDDPSAPGYNPLTPNANPTIHLFTKIVTGKTLDAGGATVALGATTQFTYNANGQVTSVSGPTAANYTAYTYDPTTGYRTGVQRYVNGSGSSHLDTTYSNFDALGNPQTVTDPNGQVTSFTYDLLSRVKTVQPPYPSNEGSGNTTLTFTYDVDGDLTRVDFPPDSLGNPYFLTMGYDTKRRLTYLADAQQNAIVYDYTAGRATEKSLYTGFVSLTARGTKVGDSTFSYDTAGRLVKAFNPLFTDNSIATQFSPDGNGNPVSVTDENGHTDNLMYDALNRLTQIQQVRTGTFTTGFAYDSLSDLTKVTDAAGKETDYTYDDLGRLVKVVSPDTGTTLYLYDAAGNLVTKVEDFTGSRRTTNYTYDGLNRLTGVTFPTDPAWTFTYDTSATTNQMGRLASVTNGTVTTELEYSARGKVLAERTTVGGKQYSVLYRYDVSGNLASIQEPSGVTTTYSYSGSRPQQLSINSGPTSTGIGNITISGGTQISNIAFLPFGPRISADFGGGVSSQRQYNLRYQMTGLQVTTSTTTYLNQSYIYNYTAGAPGPNDPGPNLDALADNLNPSQSRFFFYDPLDRLSEDSDLSGNPIYSYSYDAVGNRSQQVGPDGPTSYSYEPNTDRLASATGAEALQYAHDAYGNRIWAGAAPYSGTPSLKYNESNRLVEVDDPNNPTTVLGQYTYDAFGRRVQKVAGGVTTLYLYDLAGHLSETVTTSAIPNNVRDVVYIEDELVGVVDQAKNVGAKVSPSLRGFFERTPPDQWLLLAFESGALLLLLATPVRRALPSAAPIALLAAILSINSCGGGGPTFYWVYTDYIGKPLAVTNSQLVWTATYTPFGLATPNTNPSGAGTFNLDFRFPGQIFDAESGLHYNFYRTYDPAIGRYLESDPLGLQAGVNVYTYAQGSPTNLNDPNGRIIWIPIIVAGVGAVAGGTVEGTKAYACGARGLDLAAAVGRGALAGGVASLTGLIAAVATESPIAAGAAGAFTFDAANGVLGGDFNPEQAAVDTAWGAALGPVAEELTPAVRGGWNFNPFTSTRTFGSKALQLYTGEAISQTLDASKDLPDTSEEKCGCDATRYSR
ncbi:MAG TPA: RHS repeat-associated core domain-containing protein [Myxococcota bacterium]|nr:RHS repeat-associated core domain-containing protein [Myxococcota bacterium]